ncbi:CD166 antigen-like protein A Activated leukocyte cell adhesion molecule A DM-GRASP-like protein [Larimichthys crocea]|uniref:CD166 antigen-like protein A Activated leukocyte cell adhesion molecule A DM-GRASP-like protein n=1 Tax=Larimichthys crocea TaxID=215358 RepID=A0A6G0I9F4_LARCR|nr:CD166 antigen isoform X1 [Larimichthys crocea]XP_027129182.1 CD166 antigen isoform X1 [Larimichthys crocea]KAE8288115.1 CD166 antigen-like protein A Activated leukocyte cell adhesion molecule A DM-GRASP-like protein [Larimichthys crocea]
MDSAAFLLLLCVSAGTLLRARGSDSMTALYGETITIPCNSGAPAPADLMFVKWKYEKADGTPGDLLIKQAQSDQPTVQATDDYAQRVSIDDKYNLLITKATLSDQKTFTCMVVSGTNLMEYSVTVSVSKKPTSVEIIDKADVLQKDKPVTLGTCVATDANPRAEITWTKNGQLMVADGKAVVIIPSLKVNPATGLSTTSSTLQYVATKEDADAVFVCVSTHEMITEDAELEPFAIHYPSETVSLQIMSKKPVVEGDNVTLKCNADGNPPPSSYFFHLKGQKMLVENSDTYTLTSISREAAGEYKCTLPDNEKMEDTQNIVVSYLDLNLSLSGKVVKKVGEALSVQTEKSGSGDVKVSWTKNGKTVAEPQADKLSFADAGVYVCVASIPGVTRRKSFELVVEGKPVITGLSKHRADDAKHKVLTCEAVGVPEPSFTWSVNSTDEESSYVNNKATHKITVVPRVNLTVTCTVSNKLGEDVRTINVSSVFKEESEKKESQEDSDDQAKLIVGVVAGLLIAAAVVGLIYWLYMKNSRQGSWKTGEKEVGTSEESKKLEENNHAV